MNAPQLTHETFSDFVSVNPFVVVHCWAAWNNYDHAMRALMSDLMPDFPNVSFAEFDVDPPGHRDICRKLNVHGPPFLALYRDGELVLTRVGLIERNELRTLIVDLINPPTKEVR